jgi:hypothetical protein
MSVAVFVISGALAIYFLLRGGFTFFGDSYTYFLYADLLVHGRFAPDLYIRTPGYPALIILSGYTGAKSVIGLLLLQAVFATLMPWLVYKTFSRFNLWLGVVAAVTCLCSLTPVFFENTLYPDGAYLFFAFAALYFLGRLIATGRPQSLYLCFACLAFDYFLRPAGLALIVSYAVLLALWYRHLMKQLLAILVVIAIAIIGFGQFEELSLRHSNGMAGSETMVGRQMFLNAYLRSAPYGGFEVAGNTFAGLKRDLLEYFTRDPARFDPPSWGHRLSSKAVHDLYGEYEAHPSTLVDRMFTRPDFLYYWMLFDFADRSPEGDRQLSILWLKYLEEHPLLVGRYASEDFADLAVGQAWTYGPGVYPENMEIQSSSFWPVTQNVSNGGPMPPQAMDFLSQRQPADNAFTKTLQKLWSLDYSVGRPTLLAFMILGWLSALRESLQIRRMMTAVVIGYVVNTVFLSLLVDPEFRYQIQGMALSSFSAGAGVCILLRQILRRTSPDSLTTRVG